MAGLDGTASNGDTLLIERSWLVVISIALGAQVTALPSFAEFGSFRDIKVTPDLNQAAEARGELRTDAQEAADLLNVRSLVERIRQAKREKSPTNTRPLQNARLLCMWRIFIASEEVRKAVAAIDFELSSSYADMDSLMTRKGMTLNTLNTYNFMQSGALGIVKQSGSFPGGNTPTVNQTLGITAFGTRTALSIVNLLVVPHLFSRKIDSPPNTLAIFFDEHHRPPDADSSYLWKFFSTPIAGSGNTLTRREILIKHWQSFARLNTTSEITLKRLSQAPDPNESMSENIRVISQRLTLLHDLKTHLEELDGSLYELHKSITVD